jgi:hypothetical protein
MTSIDAAEKCACGHKRGDHIYEEGACRPGFACADECGGFRSQATARLTAYVEADRVQDAELVAYTAPWYERLCRTRRVAVPWREEVEALAVFNAERARGLVHSPEYIERMAQAQSEYDDRRDFDPARE